MPKVSDVFAGEFYNASHFTEHPVSGIIVSVVAEQIGRPPTVKLVLDLRNADGSVWPRRLPLNRSNSVALGKVFGDDTDNWVNRAIEVWSAPTTFDDKPTMGVMVAPAANGAGGSVIVMPAPAKTQGGGDLNDAIPF